MKRLVAFGILALLAVGHRAYGGDSPFPPSDIKGFFFNVDIDLEANGSGVLRLTYPSNPGMNIETERQRFASPVTEMKQVDFVFPMVRTTIAFKDMTRLAEAKELSSITASRETLPDGRERMRALLRSYITGNAKTDERLAITVNLPGPIDEANTQEIKGATAVWRPAAVDFFKEQGITLEAVYRPAATTASAAPQP